MPAAIFAQAQPTHDWSSSFAAVTAPIDKLKANSIHISGNAEFGTDLQVKLVAMSRLRKNCLIPPVVVAAEPVGGPSYMTSTKILDLLCPLPSC